MANFVTARVVDPDKVVVQISATMTLREWKQVYERLSREQGSGQWNLAEAISKVILKMEDNATRWLTEGVE